MSQPRGQEPQTLEIIVFVQLDLQHFDVVRWIAEADEDASGSSSHGPAWNSSNLPYADEMLELLLWSPELKSLPRFSLCSLPLSYHCSKLDMFTILGHILAKGGDLVKTIVWDNHKTHGLIRCFMLGKAHGLDPEQLQRIPFWRDVRFEDFPKSSLPEFPFRRPVIGSDTLPLEFYPCKF